MQENALNRLTNTINKLKGVELAISELYAAFAELDVSNKEFWLALKKEELFHVQYLQKMQEIVKNNFISFSEGRLVHEMTIDEFIAQIEQKKNDAKDKYIDTCNFINVAKNIEDTILEKDFLSLVIGVDRDFAALKNKIIEDTKRHLKMITNRTV